MRPLDADAPLCVLRQSEAPEAGEEMDEKMVTRGRIRRRIWGLSWKVEVEGEGEERGEVGAVS